MQYTEKTYTVHIYIYTHKFFRGALQVFKYLEGVCVCVSVCEVHAFVPRDVLTSVNDVIPFLCNTAQQESLSVCPG